ncbi:MAG: SCE4755 family polysaccharide monooxygenase-like protein [Myxococcota bacterium]
MWVLRNRAPKVAVAAAFTLIAVLAPRSTRAHFTLHAPASWANQDAVGNPQKSAPCGQADPGMPAVATGKVTAFSPGETITIIIDETVFHPGHYRVALAVEDRGELPMDPPVTAGTTPCGSTVIEANPSFPILVDGALKHSAPFTSPQSFQVTLPSNVTCARCTLQVVEFMSSHDLNNPGGCFYHHCADISIQAQAGNTSGGAANEGGASASGGALSMGGASAGRGGAAMGGSTTIGGNAGFAGTTTGGTLGAGGRGGISGGGAVGLAGADSGGPPGDTGCGCRTKPRSPTATMVISLAIMLGCAARRHRARRCRSLHA